VSALAIIVIVVLALLLLLFVGGLVANARRSRQEDPELRVALREADQALAAARAEDRGWDRDALEAAAREAFAARSPVEPRELQLLKVVDRPGTEDDQCVFRVVTDVGSEEILLVRSGGVWGAAEAT
jgi:type II secretory pathway pseudopilin PulG